MSKPSKNIDYIADSRAVVSVESPKYAYLALVLMLLTVVFGLFWASMSEIEEVTNADGRIITTGRLQIVQHLEGGIVKKIHVKEGEKIKAGQLMVELDEKRFLAEYGEGMAKLKVLQAEMIRLEAESLGETKLVFDNEFESENPDLVAYTRNLFESNSQALNDAIAVLDKSYKLMEEELNIIRPLAKSGVMSDVDLIRLERQLNSLGGQVLEKKENARQQSRDALNKVKAEYAMLKERLIATKDRMERTDIVSPVDGTVNQVYVSSVGEVILAGSKVADVVPAGDTLTIQANIRPTDIGFIYPGQRAMIKVSAYDFSIYGGLDGKILTISPDATVDESGQSYFEAKLQTEKNSLRGKDGKLLTIMPGMTVTASIVTGKKSILDYILKPFYKARYTALRER